MEQNQNLAFTSGELLKYLEQCRKLIEWLIYLGVTRPILTYFVHILSRFMYRYDIVNYTLFKENPCQGILLRAYSDISLQKVSVIHVGLVAQSVQGR